MTNTERALLGLPLAVRIIRCGVCLECYARPRARCPYFGLTGTIRPNSKKVVFGGQEHVIVDLFERKPNIPRGLNDVDPIVIFYEFLE